jgi:hypothetical protein
MAASRFAVFDTKAPLSPFGGGAAAAAAANTTSLEAALAQDTLGVGYAGAGWVWAVAGGG